MSRAPFVMGKAATVLARDMKLEDTTMGWRFINPALKAAYGADTMPETGENVTEQFGLTAANNAIHWAETVFAAMTAERTESAQNDSPQA